MFPGSASITGHSVRGERRMALIRSTMDMRCLRWLVWWPTRVATEADGNPRCAGSAHLANAGAQLCDIPRLRYWRNYPRSKKACAAWRTRSRPPARHPRARRETAQGAAGGQWRGDAGTARKKTVAITAGREREMIETIRQGLGNDGFDVSGALLTSSAAFSLLAQKGCHFTGLAECERQPSGLRFRVSLILRISRLPVRPTRGRSPVDSGQRCDRRQSGTALEESDLPSPAIPASELSP